MNRNPKGDKGQKGQGNGISVGTYLAQAPEVRKWVTGVVEK